MKGALLVLVLVSISSFVAARRNFQSDQTLSAIYQEGCSQYPVTTGSTISTSFSDNGRFYIRGAKGLDGIQLGCDSLDIKEYLELAEDSVLSDFVGAVTPVLKTTDNQLLSFDCNTIVSSSSDNSDSQLVFIINTQTGVQLNLMVDNSSCNFVLNTTSKVSFDKLDFWGRATNNKQCSWDVFAVGGIVELSDFEVSSTATTPPYNLEGSVLFFGSDVSIGDSFYSDSLFNCTFLWSGASYYVNECEVQKQHSSSSDTYWGEALSDTAITFIPFENGQLVVVLETFKEVNNQLALGTICAETLALNILKWSLATLLLGAVNWLF